MLRTRPESQDRSGGERREHDFPLPTEWIIDRRPLSSLLEPDLPWPDEPLLITAPRSLADSATHTVLSTDEWQRLNGLLAEADRERFRLVHYLKRRILGHLLNQTPRSLTFHYSERGKPWLVGQRLAFNLSHSGDWVMVGVRDSDILGVDIEEHRPDLVIPMVRWVLHADEYREWAAAGYPDAGPARYWNMKEALAKATGAGVALPFYCARLYPRQNHYECWYQQRRWFIDQRSLDERHCLALATDHPARRVRLLVLESG